MKHNIGRYSRGIGGKNLRPGGSEPRKAKHTPGPWKADYAGGYGKRGVFGPNGLIVTTWAETDEHINEAEANAALIASAPDLLEACNHLLSYLEQYTLDCTERGIAFEIAKQAIAKAEGKTQTTTGRKGE